MNITDPDSRVMKSRQGYVQGYNLLAVVSEDLIMVSIAVTREANDVRQLEQTLEADGIEERPKVYLADAGHWSDANIKPKVPRQSGECSGSQMPELLIATAKDWKQRQAARERGCPHGRIPKGLGPRERMELKFLTKRGRALYKKRGVLVEPVFGQVKEGLGFRRFMRRRAGCLKRGGDHRNTP